jgi:hypothetical protein
MIQTTQQNPSEQRGTRAGTCESCGQPFDNRPGRGYSSVCSDVCFDAAYARQNGFLPTQPQP